MLSPYVTIRRRTTDIFIWMSPQQSSMQRSERKGLETLRRNLKRDLQVVEEVLRVAQPARRLTRGEIRTRARNICRSLKAQGRTVSDDALREIVAKHGMPFASVGALFNSGYLRKSKKGIALGRKGLAALKQ